MTSRRISVALPVVGLVAALSLAACGEDYEASTSPTGASTAASQTPSAQAQCAPPAATPEPRVTGGALVPKVQNAKDLQKKPVAAGAGASAARPQELIVEDLVVGTGQEATALDQTVQVQYAGTLYRDGKPFDASWDNGGQPIAFPLNRVVPGFGRGILGMKEGGRRVLVIPAELGYGADGSGPIPPDSDLVFVVDLVKVQC